MDIARRRGQSEAHHQATPRNVIFLLHPPLHCDLRLLYAEPTQLGRIWNIGKGRS